ncbi:MAG TPA: hypothetical protein PL044_03700 [Clostridiales bacterium]|nr:MAG: hypothetical protein BWY37_00410 [Firmicutes bacterium ADurb.Bin262]HOU09709.1 hypothetical protein [Clostridiales bacterium]HQH63951.1 hypothetical protein [Clostridiales bacterium]HQK72863.1 hypothetical protein [Clostridiales bacterium]
MRTLIKAFLTACIVSFFFTVTANAADTVKINDLINKMTYYNGRLVTVEGEAVGETLERGEYAWVNINDGSNAIGIWLTSGDAERISYFGDYKHIGDTVRITGVFSENCSEHGGDVDIHCDRMDIVCKGYVKNEVIPRTKIIAALILFGSASTVTVVYFTHRRFQSKLDARNYISK